jgi:hypothetical protein
MHHFIFMDIKYPLNILPSALHFRRATNSIGLQLFEDKETHKQALGPMPVNNGSPYGSPPTA